MDKKNKKIRILGIRGLPAKHGGFETFAQYLALYLVEHGWQVIVYCQEEGEGATYTEQWKGVELIHVPLRATGSKGSIVFDWKTTKDAAKYNDLVLTLGYNTAVFCLLYRLKKVKNIINMDGIEWKRQKWSFIARLWFYINDWCGCLLGNHLVADHPEIANHLSRRVNRKKISVIPYGADRVKSGDQSVLKDYGLIEKKYSIVIARPEPENSILEIVKAFSVRPRDHSLVVLGEYFPEESEYHRQIFHAASEEVKFVGAIYDAHVVQSLRFFAAIYVHGHQVGGTNPSLVEALGAGNPVLAHDNKFNRWVAGPAASYFSQEDDCATQFDTLLANEEQLAAMHAGSVQRYNEEFTWEEVLSNYEKLFVTVNS